MKSRRDTGATLVKPWMSDIFDCTFIDKPPCWNSTAERGGGGRRVWRQNMPERLCLSQQKMCRRDPPALHDTVRKACKFSPSCASMPPRQSQEDSMTEVVFYALGGRSVEQKRALVKDFTDAVVKNYKVDPSAVTITIVESPKEDKAKGGVLFSDMGAPKS